MDRKSNSQIRWTLVFGAILLFSWLLFSLGEVEARCDGPVELNSLELVWRNYTSPGRDLLIYPYEHNQAVELQLKTDVLKYFYFDASVTGIQDETQYRGLMFHSHIGVRLTSWVRIEHEHDSEHGLDGAVATLPRFPVYDSITLIGTIYLSKNPREALIQW